MLVVAEKEIAGLMTPEAAFEAIEAIFASMARRKAYNFPVVREAIGHEDALYGFKGGFDASALVLGLKAGGYWPNNQKHNLINHQSTVFLFDPDTGRATAAVGGNLLTALRTAAASALVALLVALRLDLEWAGIFAIGAVAGLLNWFLLAVILIQFTERRRAYVPMLVIAKMILLVGSVFVILPLVPHQAVAFLCGFTMFLILVVAEAFGQLLRGC